MPCDVDDALVGVRHPAIEEGADAGMLRLPHLVARAEELDPAVEEHRDAVGDRVRRGQVVRHDDHRDAEHRIELGDQVVDLGRGDRIEGPPDGSSNSTMSGSSAIARAMARRRLRMPPDKLAGSCSAACRSPTMSSFMRATWRTTAPGSVVFSRQRERDVLLDAEAAEQRAALERQPPS